MGGVGRLQAGEQRVALRGFEEGGVDGVPVQRLQSLGGPAEVADEHPAFGEGVVLEVRGRGSDIEATVNFKGVGIKHLSLSFAPLRKK